MPSSFGRVGSRTRLRAARFETKLRQVTLLVLDAYHTHRESRLI